METAERALIAKQRMVGLKVAYIAKERACARCRFGPIDGSGHGKCEHFAHWEILHEPVSGRTSLRIPIATAEARSERGLCGPEGLLFEPLPRWWRISKHMGESPFMMLYVLAGITIFTGLIGVAMAMAVWAWRYLLGLF